MSLLTTRNNEFGYENVISTCPHCNKKNTFNRRDDLGNDICISYAEVICSYEDCSRTYAINGDNINSIPEALLFECYTLISQKQYMATALTITQAYEAFFYLYIKVNLIYHPYWQEMERDLDKLNSAMTKLNKKLERASYWTLKGMFFRVLCMRKPPNNLSGSLDIIEKLGAIIPMEHELEHLSVQVIAHIHSIQANKSNSLRNKVVHKIAYRPSLTEVEELLKEARETIFGLGHLLNIHDEISFYSGIEC